MWLLNTDTLELEEFQGENEIPEYAILSHTWDEEEVTFQEVAAGGLATTKLTPGHAKILNTCMQARKDGLAYAWVDTCCMNKLSSSELNESINSMYRWYKNSKVCYVFMSDVSDDRAVSRTSLATERSVGQSHSTVDANHGILNGNVRPSPSKRALSRFQESRWFKRGWTLQELVAPIQLFFFDHCWRPIGSLQELSAEVSRITGIDNALLLHEADPGDFSVAKRMSWAANRSTKRPEDRAYSLLGLFDISLPMLYGEGEKAFIRLQEEIIRSSCDQSIFAWKDPDGTSSNGALLAPSPSLFVGASNIIEIGDIPAGTYTLSNRGLDISFIHPVHQTDGTRECDRTVALLNCRYEDDFVNVIALRLSAAALSGVQHIETPRLKTSALNFDDIPDPVRTTVLRRRPQTRKAPTSLPKFMIQNERKGTVLRPEACYPPDTWNLTTMVFLPNSAAHSAITAICFRVLEMYVYIGIAYEENRYAISLSSARAMDHTRLPQIYDKLRKVNLATYSGEKTFEDIDSHTRVAVELVSKSGYLVYVASIRKLVHTALEYQEFGLSASATSRVDDFIRLLNLYPQNRGEDESDCELHEIRLTELESVDYEVLSMCFDRQDADETLEIDYLGRTYLFEVPSSLVEAFNVLRQRDHGRKLWVEFLCSDQASQVERNRQVCETSRIYGLASGLRAWVGPHNSGGQAALDFITQEILRLEDFDRLCDAAASGSKWLALFNFMERPWFCRLQSVQEVVLAKRTTIHCGRAELTWGDFTDAIQLLIEVGTAMDRISEVSKTDPRAASLPGWLEYVPTVGASLLITATDAVVRKRLDGVPEPLLNLEQLVSITTTFMNRIPHDTVYSLLAIAKDAAPSRRIVQSFVSRWLPDRLKIRSYLVDYDLSVVDFCKQFILHCLANSDPRCALDILFRPWAPLSKSENLHRERDRSFEQHALQQRHKVGMKMPSWIATRSSAPHMLFEHVDGTLRLGRQNADPLVGHPGDGPRNYNAGGTTRMDPLRIKFEDHDTHCSMFVRGFVYDKVDKVEQYSAGGNIPSEWIVQGGWTDLDQDPPDELWRTLVADRGNNGRNAPTYYARACKESFTKVQGTIHSFSTLEIINNRRNLGIGEFFRRVQAVIWNRSLIRTARGTLGIASKNVRPGDMICVFSGCSVPVVLRRHTKNQEAMLKEEVEYQEECGKAVVKLQAIYRSRRSRRRKLDLREGLDGPETLFPSSETSQEPSTIRTNVSATSRHDLPGQRDSGYLQIDMTPGLEHTGQRHTLFAQKMQNRLYWYEVIGECYVHGMMDGEAVERRNAEQIPTLTFELR